VAGCSQDCRGEVVNCRSAPRAATWLLERLGSGSRFEPLIGDLVEQFEAGRSRLWYWRQALGSLLGHTIRALRTHAFSFVTAVVAGCVLTSLWQLGCSLVFHSVYVNLAEIKQHPWTLGALLRFVGMQANMASEYALCFISAWLVIRVHRAHQRAVLAAFVVALIARSVPTVESVSVVTQVILMTLRVACILVAGLWVIQRRCLASIERRTRFVAILWSAQNFITCLLFASCRVGELSYRRSEFYLSMYAAAAGIGLYLALLLWRDISSLGTTRVA